MRSVAGANADSGVDVERGSAEGGVKPETSPTSSSGRDNRESTERRSGRPALSPETARPPAAVGSLPRSSSRTPGSSWRHSRRTRKTTCEIPSQTRQPVAFDLERAACTRAVAVRARGAPPSCRGPLRGDRRGAPRTHDRRGVAPRPLSRKLARRARGACCAAPPIRHAGTSRPAGPRSGKPAASPTGRAGQRADGDRHPPSAPDRRAGRARRREVRPGSSRGATLALRGWPRNVSERGRFVRAQAREATRVGSSSRPRERDAGQR